ncbi:MAG: DUF554 domain-containing protein [Candidatus Metalachnospira sp.]|nr:DUF554 domain-containing protein [Candidatus Metalachnospira sp.]
MIGVIVNTVTVILGSLIGLLCKKGIPQKVSDAIMRGIGLCTLYIGISGSLKGEDTLVLIISMVLGIIIGTLIDIDDKINRLGRLVERRFSKADGTVSVSEGFVTASLLFCIGAMTIVGSLNAGLAGDNKMLFTKSVLDFVSSIMLSVSLGIGVLCSAAFVLVFQGAIVLLAQFIAPILTDSAIAEMTCAGSIMIIGLSLNILGLTKLKTANMLPALVVVPIVCYIFSILPFNI